MHRLDLHGMGKNPRTVLVKRVEGRCGGKGEHDLACGVSE